MTASDPTVERRPRARGPQSMTRVALRLVRHEPVAYATTWIGWVVFFSVPLATGLLVKVVLDRVAAGSTSGVWVLLAAVVGIEAVRWAWLVVIAVQWHGCWVGWQTVPRVNMLRSLAEEPGPAAGRLPGAPGEAVSRFRDDVEDVAMVLDVWLDVSGALVSSIVALVVLVSIEPSAAAAVAVPVVLAMAGTSYLGPRLRVWRREAREATARVTGFIGDTFGAVLAVQSGGAEPAVRDRFARLNADRARVGRRDQVGSELIRSLGYGTGEVAAGVALVVVASAFAGGDLSVGDLGLFAAYASMIADLPKWVGRYLVFHRQADVSVDRLAELLRTPDRRAVAAPTRTWLRHGPPPLDALGESDGGAWGDVGRGAPAASGGCGRVQPAPVRVVGTASASGGAGLRELRAEGLTVRHPGSGRGITDVDLVIRQGELVVVTGPVGAGKTTLLRALLGLVATDAGTLRWNGTTVVDPSSLLVPPRAAYLPQVPRLFSEPLADTVLLGVPPDGLDHALWLTCLDEDLATMPAGAATLIGPRGLRLSGGQIQRAGAARALVRQPDLLVVDDLSSALDVATEARLWDRVAGGGFTTALLVSHRPHVLERADRIVVLDGGRVADVVDRGA
ncbi:MAG: ABC transporter ATP-binding protein [Acidimicrobiales bacterium]|nr:ABC transporter ATP-binding protein [Acidimicrobiales bacterium]